MSTGIFALTLNRDKYHANWYQNVAVSGFYHHTTFQTNRYGSVQTLANVNVFSTICK